MGQGDFLSIGFLLNIGLLSLGFILVGLFCLGIGLFFSLVLTHMFGPKKWA